VVKQRKELIMPIKLLAALLLVVQVGTVVFIVSVLKRQWGLFKLYVEPEIKKFRRNLFILALSIFLGNLIPMTIGFLTVIGAITRSASTVNLVSGIYTVANTFTLFFSSLLIWTLYRLANAKDIIVEHDKVEALQLKRK